MLPNAIQLKFPTFTLQQTKNKKFNQPEKETSL